MTSLKEQIGAFALKAAREAIAPDQTDAEAVRAAVTGLLEAYFDAVRAEWQSWLDANPELKADVDVARQLMLDAGYPEMDPICGVPGVKPMIAKVDGIEAVSFEHSMNGVMPLSAIFLNKVREVKDAASKVSAAKLAAEASASEQPAPPQK